jgi:hypothetical protein
MHKVTQSSGKHPEIERGFREVSGHYNEHYMAGKVPAGRLVQPSVEVDPVSIYRGQQSNSKSSPGRYIHIFKHVLKRRLGAFLVQRV